MLLVHIIRTYAVTQFIVTLMLLGRNPSDRLNVMTTFLFVNSICAAPPAVA